MKTPKKLYITPGRTCSIFLRSALFLLILGCTVQALISAGNPPVLRHGRVSLPEGGHLSYYIRPGTGNSLVLIPGSWGDRHVYDEMLAGLDASLQVVIIELRGHGESWPPTLDASIESFANDVLLVTETLKLHDFFVGGHSIGGMISIELAGRRPLAIKGVIPIEGWTHHEVEREAFGKISGTTLSPEQEAKRLAFRESVLSRLSDQQISAFASAWRRWDGLPILESTSVPVLELWGDRGDEAPSRKVMRIPDMPNIRLHWLKDASHQLLIECPGEIAAQINQFIAAVDSNSALQFDSSRMLEVPALKIGEKNTDFSQLPRLPLETVTIYRGIEGESGFNMHPYLTHYEGRFYAMWSSNRVRDLQPGQHVRYSTSKDGIHWPEVRMLMPREDKEEMRYFARGFWLRDGQLIALAAYDEAVRPLFAPGLELRGYEWNPETMDWKKPIVVADDTINNFPPKLLPSNEWMMSRRDHRMNKSMLIGGVSSPQEWKEYPISVPEDNASLDEPFWWQLPDGALSAVFRDGSKSGRLYRSFSRDNGKSWTIPLRTNYPDACAKFNVLRLSDGRYALVSNPNTNGKRVPLCLALSDDGIIFDRMFILRDTPTIYRYAGKDPGYAGYHYPQLLECGRNLYVIHAENMEDIVLLRVSMADLEGH